MVLPMLMLYQSNKCSRNANNKCLFCHPFIFYRWLKKYGVAMAGEKSTRQHKNQILKSANLNARNFPFMVKADDGSSRFEEVPMVIIPDLVGHIKSNLDLYDKLVILFVVN